MHAALPHPERHLAAVRAVPHRLVLLPSFVRDLREVCSATPTGRAAMPRGAGMDAALSNLPALNQCSKCPCAKTDRIDVTLMARALAHGWNVDSYLVREEIPLKCGNRDHKARCVYASR